MAATKSGFSALIAPGLRKVFFDEFDSYDAEHEVFLNVGSSQKASETDRGVTGFGLTPRKLEGVPTTYEDPIQGFSKTYTHVSYGLGYRVTREAYDDDLYGVLGTKMSKALGESAAYTIQYISALVLNQGFDTATDPHGNANPNNEYLFSASHALVGGGTGSNLLSTPADLSLTSLQEMVTLMRKTVNDKGLLRIVVPKNLLIPVDLDMEAAELLESEERPDTANRAKNVLHGKGLSQRVLHYLTDTDAWFVSTDKAKTQLWFLWRTQKEFFNDDEFDTGDAKYRTYFRFTCGFSDWRGICGTPGA